MAINAFSNLVINISDGETVPSLDYLANKTYVNIGSGNILKVSWNTPVATNNAVDSFKIYILYYNAANASYSILYAENVGNVNEFYLKSSLFDSMTQAFIQLQIYVEAISRYGTTYNGISNASFVDVCRGHGTYINVDAGNGEAVMRRSLAFSKLNYLALADDETRQLATIDGEPLYVKLSNAQDDSTGWTLMQEAYAKDKSGNWQVSDIRYEVLTDANGGVITDQNDDVIYVL